MSELSKVMVIVNPSAGRGKTLDMLPSVDKILGALKIKYDIRLPENVAQTTALAESASRFGYNRIVAMGGDGTINAVASGIFGSEAVLGVIPAGIGNDFFRVLNIKDDLTDICRSAVFGKPFAVDVGELNGRPFFNMVGIGFDARVAQQANEIKNNLGIFTYLASIYRALKKQKAYSVKLRIDNLEIEEDVVLIAVGIGRLSGHGFALTPSAKLDDGKFDVCIAEKASKLRILQVLPRVLKGHHVREPEVKMYRCRQLEIFSENKLPLHMEGDIINNLNGKLSIKMSLNKLRVATGVK